MVNVMESLSKSLNTYAASVEVQPAIAPAEKKQRIEAGVEARLHHLSVQDVMVAAVIDREALAFEHAQRILEDRRAGLAARPGRFAEPIFLPCRESDRRRLLPRLQHVDREMRCAGERL